MEKGQIIFGVHAKLIYEFHILTPLISTHHVHSHHKQKTSSSTFVLICEWLRMICSAWFTSSSRGWSGGMQFIWLWKSSWCSLTFLLTILVAYTVQHYHIFPAGMWCLHPSNHTWNKVVSEKAGQCVSVGLIRLVSVLEVVISLSALTPQTVQFSYISRIHSVRYDSPTLNKYVIRNGGCFVQTRLTVLISIEREFLKNVPSTFFEYNKSVWKRPTRIFLGMNVLWSWTGVGKWWPIVHLVIYNRIIFIFELNECTVFHFNIDFL